MRLVTEYIALFNLALGTWSESVRRRVAVQRQLDRDTLVNRHDNIQSILARANATT
jgi:hypothetical protein